MNKTKHPINDASNSVNWPTRLEVFNPIRRWGRGWVGVEVAPHHANVYTLKESIGENSNNFCKFLNGTLESTFHGNIMKHLLFQTATLGNQVTKRPELGLEIKIFGEILVYAQCPSCPLPFRPSEMPFPQNDLPFNALHQNALSEMPL